MKCTMLTMLVAMVALFAVGCSNIAASLCERKSECNYMAAGETVASCTENNEKALDNLTSSKRSDCEKAVDACLSKTDCANFAACFNAMTACN